MQLKSALGQAASLSCHSASQTRKQQRRLRRQLAAAIGNAMEMLEGRVLLSSTTVVDHSGGFAGQTDMQLNGGAAVNGSALRLTDGLGGEARSAFAGLTQGIDTFDTTFTWTYGMAVPPQADGFTFTIQNNSVTGVGGAGGALGYAGGTFPNSLAVKFDLYDGATGGGGPSTTGVFINGEAAADGNNAITTTPEVVGAGSDMSFDLTGTNSMGTATGIDFHANPGDTFQAHLVYDGTTLTETVTDVTKNASVTQAYTFGGMTIPQIIGGGTATDTAFVGFTGATGGAVAVQDVSTWKYSGTEPTVGSPTPATNLTAAFDPTSTGPLLTWTNGQNTTTDLVQRSTTQNGTYSTIANVAPGTGAQTTYTDTSVQPNATYFYRVIAANNVGQANPSNVAGPVTITVASTTGDLGINFGADRTDAATMVPLALAPTDTAGVVPISHWNNASGATGSNAILHDLSGKDTVVGVSWKTNGTWDATVEDNTDQFTGADHTLMGGYLDNNGGTPAATTNSFTTGTLDGNGVLISGLPAGQAYDVYVYSLASVQGRGGPITLTTFGPSSQTAIASISTAYVQATAANNGAGNYVKFADIVPLNGELLLTPDPSAFRVPFQGIELVPLSPAAQHAPAAPLNLTATPGTGTAVNLSWTNNADNADQFVVERSLDGTTFTAVATVPGAAQGATVTFSDDSHIAAQAFSYRVRALSAFNGGTESGPSNVATVTTNAEPLNFTPDFSHGNPGQLLQINTIANTFTPVITAPTDPVPNALQMLNDTTGEGNSVFSKFKYNVSTFDTTFNFEWTGAVNADGATFVIQNSPAGSTALGGAGGGLGYTGIGNSVAVKFDLWDSDTGAGTNDQTGVFLNGLESDDPRQGVDSTTPVAIGSGPSPSIDLTKTKAGTATGIDFHANPNDQYQVHLVYDGTTLTETFTDLTNKSSVTQAYTVDIVGALGGKFGYVGFTGATGGATTNMFVLNWTFSPNSQMPSGNTIGGTAGNDAITLKKDADGTDIDWTLNGGAVNKVAINDPKGLTINGNGGTDTITLDNSAGDPTPNLLTLNQTGSGSKFILIGLLQPSAGHKIDIENSTVQINYSGSTILPAVQSALKSGSIFSSTLASNAKFAIADTDSADPLNANQPANTILLRPAIIGNATLSGKVGFNDFVQLARNYGKTNADWSMGDFNYDGTVDFGDLVALARNYNQSGPAATAALTPTVSADTGTLSKGRRPLSTRL